MRAIAFDPDTSTTGWALVEHDVANPLEKRSHILACGIIGSDPSLKGDDKSIEQIRALMRQLDWVSTRCVDAVLIEGQYFVQGKTNAENMNQVSWITGAIACLALPYNHAVHIVSPKLWTQGTTKKCRISKSEMHWYHTSPKEVAALAGCAASELNHVWDAAGIGRWWLMNHTAPAWRNRNAPVKRKARSRRR